MEPNTETQSQTPDPGLVPDATAPVSPPASQVVDPSVSLNQHLQSNYGLTLDEVRNLKAGMNEAQRKAAESQKRLRDYEPLLEYGKRDPNFTTYLFEKANEYGRDTGNVDPAMLSVLDPLKQEMRQLREKVEEKDFHEQMNALSTDYPEIMTPEAKQRLANDAYATGNYDLEFHFVKSFGKELIAKARSQGKQEAVKTIQANNQLYATGTTTTAVAPPVDLSQMNETQKQSHINKELDRILSDPDYAAKVAREVG